MKTIAYYKYGGPEVFQIIETTKPTPKKNEVLLKIHATTVTATEATFRKGKPLFSRLFTGLFSPKIPVLGEELAGEITEVGEDVKLFKAGENVFGTTGIGFGAYAEYLCLPEDSALLLKPKNLSFEEAAGSCDGFLTALVFLRDVAKIQKGQTLVVIGASGSIGTAAVQLGKLFGAEVTGVCSSSSLELVKSLGADYAIDYTKEDFSKLEKKYDFIFDTVGKEKFSRVKNSLKESGVFLESGITMGILPIVLWTNLFSKKKVKISATGLKPIPERLKDLIFIREQLENARLKPAIDRIYPMTEISTAHKYVDTGHKKGNVAIKIF